MLLSKKKSLICLFIACCFVAFGQQSSIVIDARNQSLNDVLLHLRNDYNMQLSFNSSALSKYNVSLTDTFITAESALATLVKPFPLDLDKVGDVYLILSQIDRNSLSKTILVKGNLRDKETGEALPYGTVYINNRLRISDALGRFAYIAFTDEPLNIEATFLGYNKLDSTYFPSSNLTCYLKPGSLKLKETTVTGKYVEYGLQSGNEAGVIRLNNRIVSSVGGNMNNSIYNILRLQPGISSTSGNDNFSMWGSYQGQNQIIYDGMTIFNMAGNNPLTHAINPFVVKDILVSKGVSGAQYGDYVGGVVEITGIDGNYHKPVVNLSLDNLMVNGMISSPIKKNSALVVAYRKLWLQDINLNIQKHFRSDIDGVDDLNIKPNRAFQDLHLKYSGQRNNGDQYAVSAYTGMSDNNYNIEQQLNLYHTEKQQQYGVSTRYATTWSSGVNSNVLVGYSGYEVDRNVDTTWSISNVTNHYIGNRIDEFKAVFDNRFVISPTQFVEAGFLTQFYQNRLDVTYNHTNQLQQQNELLKFGTYIRNHINANNVLTMDIGLRIDVTPNPGNLFFQPRIKSQIKLSEAMRLNIGLGIYNQYITQIELLDNDGNYRYLWDLYGSSASSVLSMDMVSGGISYQKNGWYINAETYYKRTDGLRRYITTNYEIEGFDGISKTSGFDFFVKKDVAHHTVWAGYSNTKTEEYFSYFDQMKFRTAMFDRRHEFKAMAIANFKPVQLSANYIYGSAVPDNSYSPITFGTYQRLDFSLNYGLIRDLWEAKLGFSLLNIFNHYNRSSSNSSVYNNNNHSSLIVTTSDVPFMPVISLRLMY